MTKRVLFVIETLRRGGAERALSNIVMHFPDDWQVDILVNDKSLIEYSYKGNILSLMAPDKKSAVYFVQNIIKRMIYLKRLKKDGRYDACISFLEGANISNILSGSRHCKTIVSIRNQLMPERSKLYDKVRDFLLIKILFCRADIIVAVSQEIASGLVHQLKIPDERVCAIVNGYDCGWINDKMKEYPQNRQFTEKMVASSQNVIVTVGRLVAQKGQWHLIRAFTKVLEWIPQALLIIVGDGPLEEYLKEMIRLYGMEDRVILTGRSENPFWFYANADVFVLPSLWEGYPNALAEAVCCGVPCIASDVHSGPREILAPDLDVEGKRVSEISEEEYGILVPICSGRMCESRVPLELEELKMAEAIIGLLDDGEKRKKYRQKCIERSDDLDINIAVSKWIDIILENSAEYVKDRKRK